MEENYLTQNIDSNDVKKKNTITFKTKLTQI